MTVFESINNTAGKASELAQDYIESSKNYVELKVFQQLAVTLSLAAKFAIIGGLLCLGIIFMSLAGAFALGSLLNNLSLGFAVVGVLFLVIALITYISRKRIDMRVIKELSEKFFH